MIYTLNQRVIKLPDEDYFIAPTATIIGSAVVGKNASIWFNVVIRADNDLITIGEESNIQDLSILHVTKDIPLIISKRVSVGHNVTLHACEIGENSLIGNGSIILDGAKIGSNCLIAAGALVTPGKIFEAGGFIRGIPAKRERDLTEDEKNKYGNHYKTYLMTKDKYLEANFFLEIR